MEFGLFQFVDIARGSDNNVYMVQSLFNISLENIIKIIELQTLHY